MHLLCGEHNACRPGCSSHSRGTPPIFWVSASLPPNGVIGPRSQTEPVQYCKVAFNTEYKSRKTVAAKYDEVGWGSEGQAHSPHILVPVLEEGRARGGEWWLDLPCPPKTEQAEATDARKPMKGKVQEVGTVGSTTAGSLRGQAVEASLTPQRSPPAGGPGPGPRLHGPWQPGHPPAP